MGKFGIFALSVIPAALQLAVFFVPRTVSMLMAGDPPQHSAWANVGIFVAWLTLGIALVAKIISFVQVAIMMVWGWLLGKFGVSEEDVGKIRGYEMAIDEALCVGWPGLFVTGWLAWKLWF